VFSRVEEALGLSKMLVNTSSISWHINPEDQHLNILMYLLVSCSYYFVIQNVVHTCIIIK